MEKIKSKYKGVSMFIVNGKQTYWHAQKTHNNTRWQSTWKTEREAAIAYDKRMIQIGKEPVNILKRKI